MEKKNKGPSTSSQKRVKGNSKDSKVTVGNKYGAKKLNPVAHPKKTAPKKTAPLKSNPGARQQARKSPASEISALEEHYAILQKEIDQIQRDNAEQIVAQNRLVKLCKEYCGQNNIIAADPVPVDKDPRQVLMDLVTKMIEKSACSSKSREENTKRLKKVHSVPVDKDPRQALMDLVTNMIEASGSNNSLEENPTPSEDVHSVPVDKDPRQALMDLVTNMIEASGSSNSLEDNPTPSEDAKSIPAIEDLRQSLMDLVSNMIEASGSSSNMVREENITPSEVTDSLHSLFKCYDEKLLYIQLQWQFERKLIEAKVAMTELEMAAENMSFSNKQFIFDYRLNENEMIRPKLKTVGNNLQPQVQKYTERHQHHQHHRNVKQSRMNILHEVKNKKQNTRRQVHLVNEVNVRQKTFGEDEEIRNLQLTKRLDEFSLNEVLQHADVLLNALSQLRKTLKLYCLELHKNVGCTTSINPIKQEQSKNKKQVFIKTGKWRLCKIRAKCVTDKNQKSATTLRSMEGSKSQPNGRNTINVYLRFVKCKLLHKKQRIISNALYSSKKRKKNLLWIQISLDPLTLGR